MDFRTVHRQMDTMDQIGSSDQDQVKTLAPELELVKEFGDGLVLDDTSTQVADAETDYGTKGNQEKPPTATQGDFTDVVAVQEEVPSEKDIGVLQEEPFVVKDGEQTGQGHNNNTQNLPATTDRFPDTYKLKGILGIGGQGAVFKVLDRTEKKHYALKRISSTTEFEEQAANREVDILIQLNHKNITRFEGHWEEDSSVEMEWQFCKFLVNNFPEMKDDLEDHFDKEDDSSSTYESDTSREGDNHCEERTTTSTDESDSGGPQQFPPEWEPGKVRVKYIVQELCEEKTLADFMEKREGHQEGHRTIIQSIVKQIADALAHLHEKGFMHRDLKPPNIFFAIDDQWVIKLGDFGCARGIELEGDAAAMTQSVGTNRYMSPEQHGSEPNYGEKCDIFALGIILFDLLFPCNGSNHEKQAIYTELKNRRIVPAAVRRNFPEETELLLKMIQTEPENRPTAVQVKSIMERLLQDIS